MHTRTIESIHITRSVNMQTMNCCFHNTCLSSSSSSHDYTYIHILSENEKKVIVLNKQFECEREREKKKERSRRMSNKLVCLQLCPIYWCIHSQSWIYKDRNHTRKKHTYLNDEHCTIYQLIKCLKRLVWLSHFLFVSSFSFLFTHFLLLVLCQTHSFLMEFQNASYIVKVKERESRRARRRCAHTHTL